MGNIMDSISWYNQHASHYAAQAERFIPKDQIDNFVRLLKKDSTVLDAGCGSGRDSRVLQNKGMKITGLDLSEELLKIARVRNPDIPFVQGDLLKLPFENHSFDGLWSHASLVHLETIADTKTVMREFNRVLKLNGIIHIYTRAMLGTQKFDTLKNEGELYGRDFQFYTKDELQTIAMEAGFSPVKCYQMLDPFYKEKGGQKIEWILYLGKKHSN